MKDKIIRVKEIWNEYELGFYVSVAGSFAMGTIHLVTTIISFSWLTFNYMLFCYIMMLARVYIWFLKRKDKRKYIYLAGAIILLIVLIPLTVSLVKTIMDKDAPHYLFDWFIYAYALYAFYKLINGIIKLVKSKKTDDSFNNVISWLALVNALFTMFMLEATMIIIFAENAVSMQYLQLFMQGFIILFVVAIIVIFITRFIKQIKVNTVIDF